MKQFTEDQIAFRGTSRKFIKEAAPIAEEDDRKHRFPAELVPSALLVIDAKFASGLSKPLVPRMPARISVRRGITGGGKPNRSGFVLPRARLILKSDAPAPRFHLLSFRFVITQKPKAKSPK